MVSSPRNLPSWLVHLITIICPDCFNWVNFLLWNKIHLLSFCFGIVVFYQKQLQIYFVPKKWLLIKSAKNAFCFFDQSNLHWVSLCVYLSINLSLSFSLSLKHSQTLSLSITLNLSLSLNHSQSLSLKAH